MSLASLLISLYLFAAPAKSGAGISLLITLVATQHLLVSCGLLYLNGGLDRGAAKRAGFTKAGKANPVQLTTREISLSGGVV